MFIMIITNLITYTIYRCPLLNSEKKEMENREKKETFGQNVTVFQTFADFLQEKNNSGTEKSSALEAIKFNQ